ncbi:MAG: 2-dehydro-3-deoxyphosphooctonate aldolase synthase [Bacteroidales bacterium]|nr:2-dehydro-3-deoxyphosphooctonate aldolase synthase [Bacteroidales bacterium]MDN5328701.1 2-dehydro-3-deoxyphosphooctonate aldolase synthase [Bacteroidales bacterium]
MIPSYIPFLRHVAGNNFFLIAGPCVVENTQLPLEIASRILEISESLKIPFIFKASYKKANRTSIHSFTGIGDEKALETLALVREKLKVPVITDFHSVEEARMAAKYVDVLQVPAFLCRQTDLLLAAAATGKTINVKKGQFLSPEAMKHAVEKIMSAGNPKVMLTERGTMFGYTDLVVDFRSIPRMQTFELPVIVDITHSLQQPNLSGVTGGLPHLISTIGKAAIAAGADGIFLETHPDPSKALSDGANMLPLSDLENLLKTLVRIRKAIQES